MTKNTLGEFTTDQLTGILDLIIQDYIMTDDLSKQKTLQRVGLEVKYYLISKKQA